MEFTKEQLSELICKHTEKENGLQDLMEIMLESLMVSERREYLQEEGLAGNKCNGYRPGRTYGGRVNQRVQHYEIFLKKTSAGVEKLRFSRSVV